MRASSARAAISSSASCFMSRRAWHLAVSHRRGEEAALIQEDRARVPFLCLGLEFVLVGCHLGQRGTYTFGGHPHVFHGSVVKALDLLHLRTYEMDEQWGG